MGGCLLAAAQARVCSALCTSYWSWHSGLHFSTRLPRVEPKAHHPAPGSPYRTPCWPQVSDEGGGIPRSGLPKMWTYLYTTAK